MTEQVDRLNEFRAKFRAEKENCSYGDFERDYGVNRWYMWHFINDDEYTPPEWVQTALGIQAYHPAPVCHCGEVHTTKRCTSNNHRPRPPRIAIRLDDPVSAATTILEHMEPNNISMLIELLNERRGNPNEQKQSF